MQLTETQRTQLEAAAAHSGKELANFPQNLRGGALTKVIDSLLNAQLIEACSHRPGIFQISAAGLQAVGVAPDPQASPRQSTKQAALIELLRRPEGATLPQMSKATGWQVHSVHGAMAGILRNKLGLEITSEKQSGTDRVYRVTTTV